MNASAFTVAETELDALVHVKSSQVTNDPVTCSATCIVHESVYQNMATEEPPMETKVSDRGMVTIPANLRRRLDIEPGDRLRWDTDEAGNLTVEVVKQRYGAFDDFEPVSMGGSGSETHDLAGHENDPAFSETN